MRPTNGQDEVDRLNKDDAHNALKRDVSFRRFGEIPDRLGEGLHYRIAGMNLLAEIL